MSASSKPTLTASTGRRVGKEASASQSTPSRSPTRLTGKNPTTSPAGITRTQSVRKSGTGTPASARTAVKRSIGSSQATNASSNGPDAGAEMDDDARAQTAATIEELQERLSKAELAFEESDKQKTVLQTRLVDQSIDHSKLEEQLQELHERIEELEVTNKETLRSKRELEGIYESDRVAVFKEKEEVQAREEELLSIIQRLKDSSSQRTSSIGLEDEERKPGLSRNASFRSNASPNPETGHFAPSSSIQRSDSRSSSRLVLQKDKVIEALRLELAEVQLRMVEVESLGGGRMQELERTLMDAKMTNAKLMEDNESFQLLLRDKILSGDLTSGDFGPSASPVRRSGGRSQATLADELEDASETDDENHRRYQNEIASLKDQNKALTSYINNIISRLLQHSEFESILDRNPDIMNRPSIVQVTDTDKDLPAPPPVEKDQSMGSGLLSRTRSMLGAKPRARPTSVIMSPSESLAISTAHENPTTAPSIPILPARSSSRSASSHRRTNSEWSSATVVNNMYRGQSPPTADHLSTGLISPRSSFSLAAGGRPSGSRITSGNSIPTINESDKSFEHRGNRDSKIESSRNSVASDISSHSSPPRSTTSGGDKAAASSVMTGNKPRPLRLVQNAAEDDAAKKAANRASWYGWFNKPNPNAAT